MATSSAPNKGSEYCKRCDLYLPDHNSLLLHKIQSGKHMACAFCAMEFKTVAGCARHQLQDHAQEQNMRCPGCGEHFKRAGAYISHIETQSCPHIRKKDLENKRKEKAEVQAALKERGLTHSTYVPTMAAEEKPKPRTEHKSLLDADDDFDGPLTFRDPPLKPNNYKPWDPEEDEKKPAYPDIQINQVFPTIQSQLYREGGSKGPDLLTGIENIPPEREAPWASGRNLFPNVPKAVAPPTELLESLALAKPKEDTKKAFSPYDPDQPGFNLEKFFNPYTSKYRCAHPNCNKMSVSSHAFYQHLKSPAHQQQKLRCPGCLRLFESATALVQHAEAQAVKCKIRDSDEYRAAVDQITGGFVDTAGRHSDNTVRYKATGIPGPETQGPSAMNEQYWEKREAERQKIIEQASKSARW